MVEGDGSGLGVEAAERVSWYEAGIAIKREVGSGEARLYWRLFRFVRKRWLPLGLREDAKETKIYELMWYNSSMEN